MGAPTGSSRPAGWSRDAAKTYAAAPLELNEWALEGDWTVGKQSGGRTRRRRSRSHYRFHARDLHLVLGSPGGKPVRFRVTIDGKAPGADAASTSRPTAAARVTGERLYQLVRQKGEVRDRTFTIEFLDPGAEAFAFTFG